MNLTHKELVLRTKDWLCKNPKYKCAFALMEVVTSLDEFPDVLGVESRGMSILIECKASRSDFLGDKKKFFRKHPELGMGSLRFYACPPNLIDPKEVPPNWGLLWIYPKIIKVIKKPRAQKYDIKKEGIFLATVLKKLNYVKPLESSLKEYTQGFKEVMKERLEKRKERARKRKEQRKKRLVKKS